MSTLINKRTKSQIARILTHLMRGKTLTSIQALSLFGCIRLASRISDLKKRGYAINRAMIGEGQKQYAQYKMKVAK